MGALTAWLWALFPVAIWAPYMAVWYTSLSALLIAALILATLLVRCSRRSSAWIGYGFLWGLEVLTNAAFASVFPFVLLWLARELRDAKSSWIRLPLYSALATTLACTPWTVRNYFALHAFVPLRSNFGLELWRFNNPGPPYHPARDAIELRKYIQMGEVAYMREKSRRPSTSSGRILANSCSQPGNARLFYGLLIGEVAFSLRSPIWA